MPGSTYSTNLKIELMATGENSGTWGGITNTNLGTAIEQAIVGYGNPEFSSDANLTISITNSNAAQAARALVLNVTSAVSLTNTRELVVPTIQKQYIVQNNTTGSQSITVKTAAGSGITIPNARKAHLYVNGTDVIYMFDYVDINGGSIDDTTIGGSTPAVGNFTTVDATNVEVTNIKAKDGTASASIADSTGVMTIASSILTTTDINGGTIDGTTIGGSSPAAGTFTTLTSTTVNATTLDATNLEVTNLKAKDGTSAGSIADATGVVTLASSVLTTTDINGGTIDGTSIGASVRAAGNFTTLESNGNTVLGDTAGDTLQVNASVASNLLFIDNTYDIGASGATRPRNLFLANNAVVGGTVNGLTITSTTGTLTVANGKTATFNNTLAFSGTDSTVMTFPSASTTVVGTDSTQTLTNKRYTPRVGTVASAATITPTGDSSDLYTVTALATNATIAAPSGTPTDGQRLMLRILDNGTSRGLTWTTTAGGYRGVLTSLPTSTQPGLVLYVGCIYNSQAGYWDVVALVQQ